MEVSTAVVHQPEISDIQQRLPIWIERIERFLESEGVGEVSNSLLEPSRYAVLGAGKRFRPSISFAVSEAFSLNIDKIIPFAAAIELIHGASLIHDDLPCIDDDDFRRGKPSCHKVYGEGITVVAGDYLIARAPTLVANSMLLSDHEKINLIKLLSNATEQLCDGQALDLDAQCTSEWQSLSSNELKSALELRHLKKTGALITIAAVGPGYLLAGNDSSEAIEVLSCFGRELGLLFQIVDDILDKVGSLEEVGKIGNSDDRLGVYTYVTIFGLEGARELAFEQARKVKSIAGKLKGSTQLMEQLVELVVVKIK